MSSKCASLSMGWENMPLYNVVSPHQIGDIPSKEVARWRSHPIWDESGICNPAWQNSKLFSRRQVPAPRQSGALGSCTEIAYPLKCEACKASPAGWVMSVGTRNPGTCFWRSTWCIPMPHGSHCYGVLFVFPLHTDTMGNALDLRSLVQTFLLPNSKTAVKCDLYS